MQIVRSSLEPLVRIGGVVDHHIHKYPDPALVAFGYQLLVVFRGPEGRVDGAVVSHIVFVIRGGRVYRCQPDLIESEIFNIIQFRDDPVEVSDPVTVAVAERVGEYLVRGAAEIVSVGRFQLSVELVHLHFRLLFSRKKQEHCCRGDDREQQCDDSYCLFPVYHPLTAPDMPST